CAARLNPRGNRPPNWFYRGFNRAFQASTDVYVGTVSRMVKRPVLMSLVFVLIIAVTAWGFVRRPTGFLPTEDQGYAIIVTVLPEGASQPRSREVSAKVNDILRRTNGSAGWVTIGGLPILHCAKLAQSARTFA